MVTTTITMVTMVGTTTTNLVNENYIYWNGNHYYRMNDGSYRIYRDGEWKPLTNNRQQQSSSNNLENDPHYRYENGYSLLCFRKW